MPHGSKPCPIAQAKDLPNIKEEANTSFSSKVILNNLLMACEIVDRDIYQVAQEAHVSKAEVDACLKEGRAPWPQALSRFERALNVGPGFLRPKQCIMITPKIG